MVRKVLLGSYGREEDLEVALWLRQPWKMD